MSTRLKNGQLVRVSAKQTVSEGRASRAQSANALTHRPLGGETDALAGFVYALTDPALYADDGPAKAKAAEHVRYQRKRLRASVATEADARELFELALVQVGELRGLRDAHPTARTHLVEQRVAAVLTMRELNVTTRTARTSVAVASRLQALGLALLDEGAKTLDLAVLSKGKDFLSTSGLMLDRALDLDRRAKASITPQWPMMVTPKNSDDARILAPHRRASSGAFEDEPDEDAEEAPEDLDDGARIDRHVAPSSGLSPAEPQSRDAKTSASSFRASPVSPPTLEDQRRVYAPPASERKDALPKMSTRPEYVRPELPEHLQVMQSGNPFFVALQKEQDRVNQERARIRRAELEATQLPPMPPRIRVGPPKNPFKKKDRR